MNAAPPSDQDGDWSIFDTQRVKAMRLVAEHADGGWFVGDDELGAVFTGAGTITANGLVSARSGVSVAELQGLRSRLRAGQELRSVQLGTEASAEQIDWAATLGLKRVGEIPTMTMDLRKATDASAHPFNIRLAGPGDSDKMTQCITDGFELDTLAASAPFANRSFLARPEVTAVVVAGADGDIVSVGVSVHAASHVVGLYAIATHPEHRRQGHGAAVTRGLMAAAREHGATVAYLQASASGAPVYTRIGFIRHSTRTYLF